MDDDERGGRHLRLDAVDTVRSFTIRPRGPFP